MRYLWHAFFARPDVPLLRLPWNALAFAGAAVAGWWDPAIWAVAGAGEFIYLLTMASNAGFQRSIEEAKHEALRIDSEAARRKQVMNIGGAARQRYIRLEEKRKRLEALYRDHGSDDLLYESNREALQKLTWIFLNLLTAQRNLVVAPASDERELRKQIAAVEKELNAPGSSEALRGSREATVRLLRERLANIGDRSTSLAEVESDLRRIETQFDLALEEATLRGRPTAMTVNLDLTSHLLTNMDDPGTYSSGNSSDRLMQ